MVLGAYSEWSADNGDLYSGCERVPMLAAVGILVLQLVSSTSQHMISSSIVTFLQFLMTALLFLSCCSAMLMLIARDLNE